LSIKPNVQIRAIEVKLHTFFELDKTLSYPAALFLWEEPPGRKLRGPQNWSWRDGERSYSFRQGRTKWRVSRAVGQLPRGPNTINGAI